MSKFFRWFGKPSNPPKKKEGDDTTPTSPPKTMDALQEQLEKATSTVLKSKLWEEHVKTEQERVDEALSVLKEAADGGTLSDTAVTAVVRRLSVAADNSPGGQCTVHCAPPSWAQAVPPTNHCCNCGTVFGPSTFTPLRRTRRGIGARAPRYHPGALRPSHTTTVARPPPDWQQFWGWDQPNSNDRPNTVAGPSTGFRRVASGVQM
mmetsp:Transcript_6328/g.13863  ORF Transcript_6328/g.13863 Transcript_6328/m.13863 type:complete len:206 (+) Transcript_6328:95-712(+)